MHLYLAQHGLAVPEDVDPERPLSPQGRTDIERLAARLGRARIVVERVLHSGKTRAAQTAEILIVGHLPFLGRLTSHLLVGDANQPLLAFQPGSLASLERDADGHWRLAWMLRPERLAEVSR